LSRLRAALPLLLLEGGHQVLFASGMLDRLNPTALVAHQGELQAGLTSHPWLARLAYVGLLTLAVSTGIPGTVLIIFAGGFVFGIAEGTALSSVALTLGSLILFLASRYAFGSGSRHPPPLVERLHHGFERHPRGYTLLLRFIPIAPFGLVTISLAWLRCPLWLFIGATWLGGTLTLIFQSSIGAGLGDALRQSDRIGLDLLLHRQVLAPFGAIVALVLLSLLLQRLLRPRH
jgi:uncharacterized membrane protein YdjX (TVP38/TMEM64 family)